METEMTTTKVSTKATTITEFASFSKCWIFKYIICFLLLFYNTMKGYCYIDGDRNPACCNSCAFQGLKCEFYSKEDVPKGTIPVKKTMETMKQRLHEYSDNKWREWYEKNPDRHKKKGALLTPRKSEICKGYCYYFGDRRPATCKYCVYGGVKCVYYSGLCLPYLNLGDNPEWTMKYRMAYPKEYKRELEEPEPEIETSNEEVDWRLSFKAVDYLKLIGGVFASLIGAIAAAWISPIFQIFTELFFGLIKIFTGIDFGVTQDLNEPYDEGFFNADFLSRWQYWASLLFMVIVWIGEHYKSCYNKEMHPKNRKGIVPIFEWMATVLFVIVAFLNFNLFISTLIGPVFVMFCFYITAKR